MTGFLASVNSVDEARMLLEGRVDIVDLKQPADGALGAVSHDVMEQVVAFIAERCIVSATIGDLPAEPDLVCPAVERTASMGVDIVKIGLFEGGQPSALLQALGLLSCRGIKIVIVLFADRDPNFSLLEQIADAGLTGVMLDTADKGRGSLRDHISISQLDRFVTCARRLGLMSGLAGSLRLADIAPLLELKPHYLGFRGALCQAGRRIEQLDPLAVQAVRAQIMTGLARSDEPRQTQTAFQMAH